MAKKAQERYRDMSAFAAALVEYVRRSDPAPAPVGGEAVQADPEAFTRPTDPAQAAPLRDEPVMSAPTLLETAAPEVLPRGAGDGEVIVRRGGVGLLGAGILVGALLAVGATTWLMLRNGEDGETGGAVQVPGDDARSPNKDRPPVQAARLAKATTNKLGMKLVLIPKGSFKMGSPPGEMGQQDDEVPQHEVEITRDFSMAATEVTVGQFRRFVNATNYKTEAEVEGKVLGFNAETGKFEQGKYSWRDPGFKQADDHPVVLVSWNDAVKFCEWLSKEGQTYELPTEAEWEYAGRAGTTTAYHSGDDPETLARFGNVPDASAKVKFPKWTTITGDDGYVFTAPVAKFRPNAWGLFDMHGNVWEWCGDRLRKYQEGSFKDPKGSQNDTGPVLRGGSWGFTPRTCRSANRSPYVPGLRYYGVGFRVVLRVRP